MNSETPKDPQIAALMAAWDRHTGRSASADPKGPLEPEHRKRISHAATIFIPERVIEGSTIGEPLSILHRKRISDSLKRRYRASKLQ